MLARNLSRWVSPMVAKGAARSALALPAMKAVRHASTMRLPTTQETPNMINDQKISMAPQNPKQEAYVRYLSSVLYPMVSEVSWDDQTSDVLVHIYPQYARAVAKVLRDHQMFQYKILLDVTAVDNLSSARRFDVVWLFLSVLYQHRLIVRTSVDDASGIDSLTPIFKSAMWAEREVWDMFGIPFNGHPDLRRMLNDYGFDGFPLRKDFPLSGYVECSFDAHTGMIRYTSPPLLREEYRDYENIETEWEDIFHRCNNAWSYDKMVDRVNHESLDTDYTFDDPSLHKSPPQKLPAHLVRNW